MHYLIIARVKDYPTKEDVGKLLQDLTLPQTGEDGKPTCWYKLYDNLSDADDDRCFLHDVNECSQNGTPYEKALETILDDYSLKIDEKTGAVWENNCGRFVKCSLGGYFLPEITEVTTYPYFNQYTVRTYLEVQNEFCDADAYVTPKCTLHYTADKSCPFGKGELVYVIDGISLVERTPKIHGRNSFQVNLTHSAIQN